MTYTETPVGTPDDRTGVRSLALAVIVTAILPLCGYGLNAAPIGDDGPGTDGERGLATLAPEVQSLVKQGDELVSEGRFEAAREEYQKAVERMREARQLPALPVRRIANAFYYEGRVRRSAKTLDALAGEASTFGDLPVHAWALADAAWLYGKMGSGSEVEDRLDHLERLLTSPYLPDEVRARIVSARLDGTASFSLR